MFTRMDDILAFAGFGFLVAGIYLWLGLPAAFILTGVTLIYAGARLQTEKQNEPDQTTNS